MKDMKKLILLVLILTGCGGDEEIRLRDYEGINQFRKAHPELEVEKYMSDGKITRSENRQICNQIDQINARIREEQKKNIIKDLKTPQ